MTVVPGQRLKCKDSYQQTINWFSQIPCDILEPYEFNGFEP